MSSMAMGRLLLRVEVVSGDRLSDALLEDLDRLRLACGKGGDEERLRGDVPPAPTPVDRAGVGDPGAAGPDDTGRLGRGRADRHEQSTREHRRPSCLGDNEGTLPQRPGEIRDVV